MEGEESYGASIVTTPPILSGAKSEWRELKTTLYSDKARETITKTCSQLGTEFHFILQRAPHFGLLWEAAVKSAKHLLIRTLSTVDMTADMTHAGKDGAIRVVNIRTSAEECTRAIHRLAILAVATQGAPEEVTKNVRRSPRLCSNS